MQNHTETTVHALRYHPAVPIRIFQQILSRPSYIQALPNTDRWRVLLGPAPRPLVLQPSADVAVLPNRAIPRVFDFVAHDPRWSLRMLRRARGFGHAVLRFSAARLISAHQWLMHPIIDSRESS